MRDRINAELKAAMKAKEREIALRDADNDSELDDAVCLEILAKMIKQREESAQVYEESGRLELAERERAEMDVIRDFLPKPLSDAEVDDAVDAAIAQVKAGSIKDMGKVMGALKADYVGRMDFGKVGALVKKKLA